MKKQIAILLIMVLVLLTAACDSKTTTAFPNPNPDLCVVAGNGSVYKCDMQWTSFFDTRVLLTVYVGKEDTFAINDLFGEVGEILNKYHQLLDKYNVYPNVTNIRSINLGSSVPDSNKPNHFGTKSISSELMDAIELALAHDDDIVVDSTRLFNIALGPILSIWSDVRDNPACDDFIVLGALVCPLPDASLFQQDFNIDPDSIVLYKESNIISFTSPNMSLDMGGFGKGYASEKVTDYLDSLQIRYILNSGNSNVKAGGINPSNNDGFYYIALKQPVIGFDFSNEYYGIVKITSGISIVTSGNYQRYFIGLEDNKTYHHIIDPRTGYPGGEAMSISILHEDGTLADIYSTALYLMTVEQAMTFVNQTEGLEAIWYLEDGTIIVSNGILQSELPTNSKTYPLFTLK